MKTLLLLREAVYNPNLPPLEEAQRPISPRGRTDALRLGEISLERELFPELVLISPTLRSVQTVEAIKLKNQHIGEICRIDELLNADVNAILSAVGALPDRFRQVMLVSNMPGLKQVLAILTGWNKSLPTSTLVYITLPIHRWIEICQLPAKASVVELWHLGQFADGNFHGFFNGI